MLSFNIASLYDGKPIVRRSVFCRNDNSIVLQFASCFPTVLHNIHNILYCYNDTIGTFNYILGCVEAQKSKKGIPKTRIIVNIREFLMEKSETA